MLNKKNAKKGQGVVEYAGALALAALVVGTVIAAGPGNISSLFTAVVADVQTYVTGLI